MAKHYTMFEWFDEDETFECEVCRDRVQREGTTDPNEEIFDLDLVYVCDECADEYNDSFAPCGESSHFVRNGSMQ